MADGHALVEINTKGEAKLNNYHFYDIRLTDNEIEEELAEQILSQLSNGINNVMVLAVFKVEWLMSNHPEYGIECDGIDIHLENYTIVVDNYKEFYREQLTEWTKYDPLEDENGEKLYHEDIVEWEEFYGEDFTPYVRKPKSIFGSDYLK